ncbi:MAG TPA: serine protease [Janthinobacterium sp.]|jgi:S1-C subfamily serine protease|nr:serine protease [Janthinobacterium sp.]
MNKLKLLSCLVLAGASAALRAEQLVPVIERVKPSIVGIGSYQKTHSPALAFIGTGFVSGDGLTIVTAAHVVQKIREGDSKDEETIGILSSTGDSTQFRGAVLVALDQEHDLAQLRIGGAPLPALQLGDSGKVSEGQAMAFTGFPLGMILGLHHVTHRAMVSSITPVVMPAPDAKKLDAKVVAQLQKPPFAVFQLDATAYPGSSGSPLYDAETGLVYGVISMVYVKGLKEAAITAPSGITYAIPGNFIRELLRQK